MIRPAVESADTHDSVRDGHGTVTDGDRSGSLSSESSGQHRLVCFFLGGQEFALPIESVRETLRVRPITRVFLTPSWLVGIFSLRGEIVPAIDVAPWLGMPRTSADDESRLVVLRHGGKLLGILVDRLADLRLLDPAEVTAAPSTLSADQAALFSGVAATSTGTIRLLDPDALLRSDWMRTLTTLAST